MAVNWTKIKNEYINDEQTTYRSLSEKYGIPHNTIMRRGADEHWREARKKRAIKATEKTIERAANAEAQNNELVQDLAAYMIKRLTKIISGQSDEIFMGNAKDMAQTVKNLRDVLTTPIDLRHKQAQIDQLTRGAAELAEPAQIILPDSTDGWCD